MTYGEGCIMKKDQHWDLLVLTLDLTLDLILTFDSRSNDTVPPLQNLKLTSLNILLSSRSLAVANKSPFCLNKAIRLPSVDQMQFLTCDCKHHLLKAVKILHILHISLVVCTTNTHTVHVTYRHDEIPSSSGTRSISVCDLKPPD